MKEKKFSMFSAAIANELDNLWVALLSIDKEFLHGVGDKFRAKELSGRLIKFIYHCCVQRCYFLTLSSVVKLIATFASQQNVNHFCCSCRYDLNIYCDYSIRVFQSYLFYSNKFLLKQSEWALFNSILLLHLLLLELTALKDIFLRDHVIFMNLLNS